MQDLSTSADAEMTPKLKIFTDFGLMLKRVHFLKSLFSFVADHVPDYCLFFSKYIS